MSKTLRIYIHRPTGFWYQDRWEITGGLILDWGLGFIHTYTANLCVRLSTSVISIVTFVYQQYRPYQQFVCFLFWPSGRYNFSRKLKSLSFLLWVCTDNPLNILESSLTPSCCILTITYIKRSPLFLVRYSCSQMVQVIYLVIYLVGHPNHLDDSGWPRGYSDTDVSIKKPITVVLSVFRRVLNEFTEVVSNTLDGSWFDLLTTLSEKKWSLRFLFGRRLFSFSEWPLVLLSVRNSKMLIQAG